MLRGRINQQGEVARLVYAGLKANGMPECQVNLRTDLSELTGELVVLLLDGREPSEVRCYFDPWAVDAAREIRHLVESLTKAIRKIRPPAQV